MNETNGPLQMFTSLTDLHRSQNSLHYGNFEWVYTDDQVVSYLREYEGDDRSVVTGNTTPTDMIIILLLKIPSSC